MRTVYQDTTTDVTLVMAKSRVSPLNHTTIPRLELCGALTLSKLLDVIRKELRIPLDQTFARTDSAIIIGWLNIPVTKLKTFGANQVEDIRSKLPASHWRHDRTRSNPADLVSRGVHPKDLLQTEIWWKGPPWLSEQPGCWPQSPDMNPVRELPDIKHKVLITKLTKEEFGTNFSSITRLLRVMDAAFYPQHQIPDEDQEEVARFQGDPTGPQSSLPPLSEVVFPQRPEDTG